MWDDDKASGFGTLEYSNGDLYEGEWRNDQRHGRGKFISFCTGPPVIYEGSWRDGVKVR